MSRYGHANPRSSNAIRTIRETPDFLPGCSAACHIVATANIADASRADAVLLASPAQHLRAVAAEIAQRLRANTAGALRQGHRARQRQAPDGGSREAAPASGAGDPVRPLLRARRRARTFRPRSRSRRGWTSRCVLQAALGHAGFRPYASDDLTGVALGGAAKNVYAIGCGIVDGMGLGESARAALLARSFAELLRLGAAMGAQNRNADGTVGPRRSRADGDEPARRAISASAAQLGEGHTRAELAAPGHPLAEGVETAPALVARARAAQRSNLPIAEAIAAVLDGKLAARRGCATLDEPAVESRNRRPHAVRRHRHRQGQRSPLRMATRDAHFAYVKETGVVRLGGPFLDAEGRHGRQPDHLRGGRSGGARKTGTPTIPM